jgi:glycosyltransferase involved in cell wall biosynthesis
MRISFFPCAGPVGYYRIVLPALVLEQELGWQVSEHATVYMDRNKRKIVAPSADVFAFNRWGEEEHIDDVSRMHDFLNDLSNCLENSIVTADMDDWMPGMKASHFEHQDTHNLGGKKYQASIDAARSEAQMRLYSIVPNLSVTTEFLRDKMKNKPGRNVTVVPNYIHWPEWDEHSVLDKERPLTIGYYGGIHGHGKDAPILKGVIGPWLEKNPEVQFFIGGDKGLHDLFGIPEDRRKHHPAVHHTKIPEIVDHIDVGVIPLYDNNFNRSKSWLKGLEMNACGIPVIASPLPSYEQWVEPGVNGFLAKRNRDWLRALDTLKDPVIRKEMGKQAREKAYENRIAAHANEWADFFSKAHTTSI